MMSIQIAGVLTKLEIQKKTASGWIRVKDVSVENKINPLITILIGEKIVAQGLAMTPAPNIKLIENSMAFSFSLNLTGDMSELKKISDFQITAEYNGKTENLKLRSPIKLALEYFLLNSAQRAYFDRIKVSFDKPTVSEQISPSQVQLPMPSVLAAAARLNPPTRKLCVITYLNDSGAWFPYFYKYYASLVGDTGIYVVTPKPDAFDNYKLGGIISCSDMQYDDQTRSELMSGLATGLQAYYQWTLVCDPDEIVIPHPNSKLSFFEMLDKETNDVLISRGFNILQMDGELDFSFDKSVLSQRYFAIPTTAVSKPHLARKPIQYSVGYHFCNYKLGFSAIDDGFLTLHLKFACQHIRKQLEAIVSETTYSNEKSSEYATHSISDSVFDVRIKNYLKKPIEDISSLAMQEFEKNYAKNLAFNSHLGIWKIGEHLNAPFLVKLS